MPEPSDRFVALDLHKGDIVIGALNGRLEVVLPVRRVPLAQFEDWAPKHLQPTDQVVFEAGNHAWYVHDLVQPLVARVVVANPRDIQLIAASCVKTDKHDTLVLARLLAANLVPAIWVPPPPVRHLRALIRHRQRLLGQSVAAKNRLQAVLQRHHFVPPGGDLFGPALRAWWQELPLAAPEKLLVTQNLTVLDQLQTLITQAGAELARSSVQEPWAAQTAFLIQLPEIGLLSAMTILAAVGDITRFPSPKELVSYAGLGTRIRDSGQTQHSGGINKEGRRELRTVLVEAAWVAVEQHPYWQEQFARLAARIGKQKAIVASARKLLVVVWHVLAEQVADRQAQEEQVARSLLNWGAGHRLATSLGMSRPEFVRQELDRLGLGQELQQFRYSHQLCRLPPSSLALQQSAAAPLLSGVEPADRTA